MSVPVFFSQSVSKKVESSFYNSTIGNYKFDTDLTYFGVMLERKVRKINRVQSILKMREVKDMKSIYPMLDEFGYSFSDFFIFKSSWDIDFNTETILPIDKIKENKLYSKFEDEKFIKEKVVKDWESDLNFNVGRPSSTNQ